MWNDNVTYEIEGENGTRITCTSLGALKRVVARIERDYENQEIDIETIMIPLEFVIGSLFPNTYNSMKDLMTQQYIDGYQMGFEDGLKKNGNWEEMV